MKRVPFKQVDVFSQNPFKGNPLAVVFEADGLSDIQMQHIARWANLSETVFVLPSQTADYMLRIFTPTRELPFAGHPTIGGAHAVLEHALISPDAKGKFTMECGVGIIPMHVTDNGITAELKAPTLHLAPGGKPDDREIARAFGGAEIQNPLAFDVGPVWMVARLPSVEALYAVAPDQEFEELSRSHGWTGAALYAIDADNIPHVRAFAPAVGVYEDPVCGSGNICVLGHMHHVDGLDVGYSHIARQGRSVGRDGFVHVAWLADGQVALGGQSITTIAGTIQVPEH